MDRKERLREAERTASEAFALAEVAVNLCMILAARIGLPGPQGEEEPQQWLERLLDMKNPAPRMGADHRREDDE